MSRRIKRMSADKPKSGKQSVLIAVPSVSGDIRWSIGNMFAVGQQLNMREDWGFSYSHLVLTNCHPTDFARNIIVDKFLETNADWLYMVDADQEVPENWPHLTMVNDVEVVSGMTYCWVPGPYVEGRLRVNQYNLDEKARCYNIVPPDTAGNPYSVNVVGTGCLAIRRSVFDKIPRPFFKFIYEENGKLKAGEDINFSVACRRAGITIAVHPQVRFGHIKPVNLQHIDEFADARHQYIMSGRMHATHDILSV